MHGRLQARQAAGIDGYAGGGGRGTLDEVTAVARGLETVDVVEEGLCAGGEGGYIIWGKRAVTRRVDTGGEGFCVERGLYVDECAGGAGCGVVMAEG